MTTYKNPVCRGSLKLGTACRRCERCLEALSLTRPTPAPDPGLVGELVESIVQAVCELPDYTSPDDQPDLIQCTVEELTIIVEREATRILSALSASGTGWSALRTDEPKAWEPVLAWCVSEEDWEDAEAGDLIEHQWLVANLSDIQPGFWWQVGTASRVYDVEGWLPLPPQEAGHE